LRSRGFWPTVTSTCGGCCRWPSACFSPARSGASPAPSTDRNHEEARRRSDSPRPALELVQVDDRRLRAAEAERAALLLLAEDAIDGRARCAGEAGHVFLGERDRDRPGALAVQDREVA